jgi:hypothetical protein
MMAQTLGMTSVTSLANIRSWQAMTPQERQQRQAEEQMVFQRTQMTRAQEKTWSDFYGHMQQASETIEATFIKGLTPVAEAFDSFLKEMTSSGAMDALTTAIDLNKNQIIAISNALAPVVGAVNNITSSLDGAFQGIQKWIADHKLVDVPKLFKEGAGELPAVDKWIKGHEIIDAPKEVGKFRDWLNQQGQPGGPLAPLPDNSAAGRARRLRESNLPTAAATPEALEVPGGGGFAIPGQNPVVEQQKATNAILSDIKDSMDKAALVGGGATVTGPGGVNLTGTGGGMGGGGGFASPGLRARGTGPTGSLAGGSGAIDTSGAGVSARAAKGALKGNQAEAYKAAIDSGLSDSSARALVANMSGEALGKPGDVHWDRTHTARGIVQWDPARSAAIKKQFGKFPDEMSVGDQTKAALWEMQTNPAYAKSWAALQGGGTAESKVGTLVTNFERPADPARAVRERLGFLKGIDIKGGAAAGGAVADAIAATKAGKAAGAVAGKGDVTSDFFSARSKGLGVNLNTQFAGDLKQAVSDAEKATGQKAEFTSLVRDQAKQAQLYYNFQHHIGGQGLAAKPGTSLHEKGEAADLAAGPVRDYIMAHAQQYGLETVRGDPEHIQMARALRAAAGDERIGPRATEEAAVKRALPARPVSRPPGGPGAPQDKPMVAMSNPLGLDNWQLAHRSLIQLNNQTGGDVHLSAMTMAS